MRIRKIFSLISKLNLKTIYFNFKYLPPKQAIYLPIFISRHVYLKEVKGTINIGESVRTGQIRIGYKNVSIFDHMRSRSIWEVSGNIVFKGKAYIGHGSKISIGVSGKLIIGENFTITAESTIVASGTKVEFGENCLLSWDILVMDTDFHKIYNENQEQINCPKSITIGNNVWIGCRSLILKGAIIPNNSIIAASSLVNGKPLYGENKIFGGQPVRELKENVTWRQ